MYSPICSPVFTRRFNIALYMLCCTFVLIIIYLFYLQVTLTFNFFQLGRQNFLRQQIIIPARGNITDVHGNLLATNRPLTTVYWQGTRQKQFTTEQKQLIQELTKIISAPDSDPDTLEQVLAPIERKGQYYCLLADASFEQLCALRERFAQHANIFISKEFKRYYPYKSLASHILGYLACIQGVYTGCMGLELLCEEQLKGHPGRLIKTVNSLGHHVATQQTQKALTGTTVHTTLDLSMQLIAEDVFPKEARGALVILDPQTGALEAVVSYPHFDPSIFLQKINAHEWQQLQEKKCFLNRAFCACYPPASLFKLVTLAAALENSTITSDTHWYCSGSLLFANRPYHCARHSGHGLITTQQALAKSCNIPFFDIARKIKIDVLAQYAHYLGLGNKTQNFLPEKSGFIPRASWKKIVKKERWYPGDTLSAAIGQGYLEVTPIQIARMISALCQGYLVKPRILMSEPIIQQPLELQPQTREFLKECMHEVAHHGSARALASLKDFTVYCKTGTAQTSDLSKRHLGKQFTEHGWFAACIQYKSNKPFTLVIIIENIGSSQAALAVAHNFLLQYQTHYTQA